MRIIRERYRLLDAFRGIAILWIVCFHILNNMEQYYGSLLSTTISYGYLGVSIFFVISGYGIANSIFNKEKQKNFTFLTRRFKRIYFTYWWHLLFAAILIPVFCAFFSMFKTHTFSVEFVHYSLSDWLGIVTLLKVFTANSWRLNEAFLPLNGVIWFIAIIVQIYLFISLCLFLNRSLFIFVMFVTFFVSFFSNFSVFREKLPYGIFLPYFFQFFIGVVVYFVLKSNLNKSLIFKLFTIFAAFVFLICSFVSKNFLSIYFSCFIGCLFILLFQYDAWLRKLMFFKFFTFLGYFSYSLYLMHIPLWSFVDMFVRNLFFIIPFHWAKLFILIPGIIFLSFIWFLFFEKPSDQIGVFKCLCSPINTIISGFQWMLNMFRGFTF